MGSRYNLRRKLTNTKNFYKAYMRERGLKKMRHYNTPRFQYPSPEQIDGNVQRIQHTWKSNDMYWKLAAQHYGDPEMWWVIAWFNKKPTESHLTPGDIIFVPIPLDSVLRFIG